MDVRRRRAIDELNDAREALAGIPKDTLTFESINTWLSKWDHSFIKAGNLSGRNIDYFIRQQYVGYQYETDVAVLDEVRTDIVEEIQRNITLIDSQAPVKSVLQDRISKVTDIKLHELLEEFNKIKDIAPNHAAIGFRTILCLLLQERAKLVKPNIRLATTNNLTLSSCIADAVAEQVLPKDQERLLNSFLAGGNKDVFDFVCHRPGKSQLVDKIALNDAVNLLNNLLPLIIP